MLDQHFDKLGFGPNEVKVYLSLAESGKTTAQFISKRCKVPRTTVYFVLEQLTSKGLVLKEQKKGTTYFSANKPTALVEMVKREEEALREKEKVAKELAELVSPYFKGNLYSVPTLQFFEGKENVRTMLYQHLPDWLQSMREYDNVWWGYQDDQFLEEYQDWVHHYWSVKKDAQKVHVFSNQSDLEGGKAIPNRIIRPVPKPYSFNSNIWVCGDYLIVVMSKNKPQYAFQLKDRVLASNLKIVFELLWNA